jgi:NAD(P)H-hydrate repair Nnr-like enzyme with NAD(P)H-hydrate dehydratase domain
VARLRLLHRRSAHHVPAGLRRDGRGDILGGVVAALLSVHVVGKATAPTIEADGDSSSDDTGSTATTT